MSNLIVDYISAHQTVIWPIVSGVLLLVLRRHTAAEWIALGEKNPRLQGFIKFLRGAGLDPQKALEGALQTLTGQAPVDPRDKKILDHEVEIITLRSVNNAQANEILELQAWKASHSEGALR